MNNNKRNAPRKARKGGRRQETDEERMLRQGGWTLRLFNPGASAEDGFYIPFRAYLVPPNGKGFFTVEEAVAIESAKPRPTGEMLKPIFPPREYCDLATGIPWAFGKPPPVKCPSKKQMGRDNADCQYGYSSKTKTFYPKNRAYRRRSLQRP